MAAVALAAVALAAGALATVARHKAVKAYPSTGAANSQPGGKSSRNGAACGVCVAVGVHMGGGAVAALGGTACSCGAGPAGVLATGAASVAGAIGATLRQPASKTASRSAATDSPAGRVTVRKGTGG